MARRNAQPVLAYEGAAANLPDEYFLGQIVAFTITEADVNLEKMRDELAQRDLRADLLKKRLRRIDAFKKATNDVATKFTKFPDHQNALIIRPVGQDEQEAHRHVLFETATWRSGRRREVTHKTIFRIMYDRGARQKDGSVKDDFVTVEQQIVAGLAFTPEERLWIDRVIGEDGTALRERFEHNSTHLDSHGVRTFVRDYLDALDAINVKGTNGGGLYFVPQRSAVELRGLSEFVKSVGSSMHLIPLLDIVDQRDMLAEAFVADTVDEIRALSAEMSKILDDPNRKITEDTYQGFVDKAGLLMAKGDDYEELLGRKLDAASLELQVFKLKTLNLQARVRAPKTLAQKR